ncbi:MAG: YaaL family protein [Butyrivibrio sp.]|nr:YaaL family protein [Butyrivibrio sp.]
MKNRKTLISYDEKYLEDELREAKNALAAAYSNFDNVTDPNLIDYCIYQVNSLQMKYQFLVERARLTGLQIKIE